MAKLPRLPTSCLPCLLGIFTWQASPSCFLAGDEERQAGGPSKWEGPLGCRDCGGSQLRPRTMQWGPVPQPVVSVHPGRMNKSLLREGMQLPVPPLSTCPPPSLRAAGTERVCIPSSPNPIEAWPSSGAASSKPFQHGPFQIKQLPVGGVQKALVRPSKSVPSH